MNAPRKKSAMVPALAQALLALLAVAAPAAGQAPDKCTASGVMGRERFVLQHCVIAFEEDFKSVTLWLNAQPISTKEADELRTSAFARDTDERGAPRTMMLLSFWPGGGDVVPSPAA